ncbi:MAG: GntR family transcriptional regulator, partial [Betaproteobacteria bacterium]
MSVRKSKANGAAGSARASRARGAAAARHGPANAPSEDEIFARIYEAVLDHRLQPGTKLKEVALADAFGVNRAVVRKVLARLSYNRLVALRPNRAAVVASPTI